MTALLWLLLGLVVVIVGAELLLRAATRLAARLKVPPMVIGLTIVAVGTSMPELAVGIEAVNRDAGSLAIGNIVGTNTVNLLLILGLVAFIRPLALQMRTIRYELPVMVLAATVLTAMMIDGRLSRLEGGLLLVGAVVYTYGVAFVTRRERLTVREEFAQEYSAEATLPRTNDAVRQAAIDLLWLAGGIALTIIGADWLVDGAVSFARLMGVSDALIGLTIVAVGTSAPELVTSVVASIKGERDIAVGNLIGSSVYNIVFILGLTLLAAPGAVGIDREIMRVDLPVMVAAVVACIPVFLTNRQISRLEGGLFMVAYLAYVVFLIVTRT